MIEYWKIKEFSGKKCFTAGVGDTTTKDVLTHILDGLLVGSFNSIVMILGTNDVKYKMTAKETADNLLMIINYLKECYPSINIIYCTIPPVNGRWDRKNNAIDVRNAKVLAVLSDKVNVLNLGFLKDSKGSLSSEYTIDGLHFSEVAYENVNHKIENNEYQ